MRLQILTAALALASIAASRTSESAARGAPCRGPDEFALASVDDLKDLVTTTDSLMVDFRTTVGLPALPADRVTLVSDSAVCRRVLGAYNARARVPASAEGLYVLRAGDLYVAADPTARAGEWVVWFIFDRSFTFRESYYH